MTDVKKDERENRIFSQGVKERARMARNGENLDVLVHDSCPMVRREVALRGFGLDVLSKDEASLVRHAVACTGYYDLSSVNNETSSIVRNKTVEAHFDTKESLSKYADKIDKITEKVSKVDSKLDKLNTAKSTHRVRMYAEYDSATNSNKVHLKLDKTRMSAADYAQYKHDNRGLLHKIDNAFKNENVGMVYAKLHKPLTYGEDGKRHFQSPIAFHSVSIRPPKILQKAGTALWQQALKEEAGLFRYGDTAKRLLVDPASNAAKLAVLNKLNEAGRDNLAVDIFVKGSRSTLTISRVFMNYRKDMLAYKPTQLQNKRDRLAKRLDKAKMKGEIAANKAILNAANDRAKNTFGLNPKSKKDKASVKGAWTKIYDGANGKDYMAAPEKKKLDKDSMSKEEFKHQKKLNKLEKKEFKANKKAYETVNVKQAYINAATGKVETKTVTVVDKSRAKKPKMKKPSSLGGRVALAGLGELRNKAFNAMAQDDNAAVQAVGKGANAAFSEFSKAHAASLQRKQKLYEKRVEKARMKSETTRAKLQTEKSKSSFSDKKKNNKKKAQKKKLRKNRNAEIFKQNIQRGIKKARDEIARRAADFIAGKGKFVALGALGVVIAMVIPMMFIFMLGGGGGGSIVGGATTALSVYPADNKVITDSILAFNDELDKFYTEAASYISGLQASNGRTIDTSKKIYNGVSYSFGGSKADLTYDIFKLASYLSAKYRNDWAAAAAECRQIVRTLFKVDCVEENGDHKHNEWKAQIGEDKEGNPIMATLSMDIYNFFIYQNDNISIDDYIQSQLSSMGEVKEDGKTEYELHYELLMESDGGHQAIGTPLPNCDDWTHSYYTSIYGGLPPNRQDTLDNCIGVACGSGNKVAAGGDGIVSSIGNNHIVVEYENFVVTYYGDVSSTQLGTGSVVKYGDKLFVTGDIAEDSDEKYNLQIKVFDKSLNSYVNPAFVMEGYEGQMEDNKARQEEELGELTQEEQEEVT